MLFSSDSDGNPGEVDLSVDSDGVVVGIVDVNDDESGCMAIVRQYFQDFSSMCPQQPIKLIFSDFGEVTAAFVATILNLVPYQIQEFWLSSISFMGSVGPILEALRTQRQINKFCKSLTARSMYTQLSGNTS
jgi:hypothetical protein